jgi:hypothetical protein
MFVSASPIAALKEIRIVYSPPALEYTVTGAVCPQLNLVLMDYEGIVRMMDLGHHNLGMDEFENEVKPWPLIADSQVHPNVISRPVDFANRRWTMVKA